MIGRALACSYFSRLFSAFGGGGTLENCDVISFVDLAWSGRACRTGGEK